ncbi:hypothetical protein ACOZ4N_16525 [Halorientalis pallida]|uniref:transcriptional regulator FilR1 domain-containing protein n=1 Tax=Halorientalis pallida TaxID=2479928 RepID=UPI003C6FFA60
MREQFGERVVENTIDNNIDDFTEEELIYYDEEAGEYVPTAFGEKLVAPFRAFVQVAECHGTALPLLRHLPYWDQILDVADIEQISPEDITEYEGAQDIGGLYSDFEDIVEENETVREVLTWNAHQHGMEDFVAQFAETDTNGELVLKRSELVDQAPENGGMSEETAETLADEGVDLYVYEGDYPGVLFVGDTTAALWGWGPNDAYYDAAIYNGTDLHDWGVEEFETIKDQADPDWSAYEWQDGG